MSYGMIEQTSKGYRRMTHDQAERLGSYVLDAGMDATILSIERGDEYVVRISNPCYFLWGFDCWNEFCKEAKKQRKQQRREIQHAIDYSVEHRLVI